MPRKRKTPQTKRKWVNLDEEDRERVFNALFLAGTILNEDPPPGGPPILFRDPRRRFVREGWFKTSAVYTSANYGESCNISLTVRDDLNPDTARGCLEYLGFGEPLIKQMLRYYEERKEVQSPFASWSTVEPVKGQPKIKEITIDDSKMYEPFYRYLAGLTGKNLRPMLTPDEKSSAKWKARLVRQGKTWRDVRLSLRTIAELICNAITTAGIRRTIEFDAILQRLKRLESSPKK